MFIRRIVCSLPHSNLLLLPSSSPPLLLSTPRIITAAAADLNTRSGFRQSRSRPHRMMASSCRTTDAFASLPPSTADKVELVRALESTLGSSFSSEPLAPPPNPQIIVISGPSGVGKDAVIKKLQEIRQGIHFVVTATSRAKRPGEVDGKDYHFVTKEKFLSMIERNELLEYALVYGEYKGVPKQQIRDFMSKGFDIVLRVDIQGATTLRSILGRSAVFIFLVAENESALVNRLIDRKTETTDMLLIRIAMAREEIKHMVDFDYVVVNAQGKLNDTVKLVESIIDSEKAKVTPRIVCSHNQPLLIRLLGTQSVYFIALSELRANMS